MRPDVAQGRQMRSTLHGGSVEESNIEEETWNAEIMTKVLDLIDSEILMILDLWFKGTNQKVAFFYF